MEEALSAARTERDQAVAERQKLSAKLMNVIQQRDAGLQRENHMMDQNGSMKALVSTLGVMKASQADFSEQLAEIKKDLSSFRAENLSWFARIQAHLDHTSSNSSASSSLPLGELSGQNGMEPQSNNHIQNW